MVVATSVVVVLLVGTDIDFNRRVSIEPPHMAWTGAQVPRLCFNVTVRQNSEHAENGREISCHVEAACGGLNNLANVDMSVPWQISVVSYV